MKPKPNPPLSIGLLLYAATHILTHFLILPNMLHYALLISAIALELWGITIFARSPEMKNSKLRQWKLRLIGKG